MQFYFAVFGLKIIGHGNHDNNLESHYISSTFRTTCMYTTSSQPLTPKSSLVKENRAIGVANSRHKLVPFRLSPTLLCVHDLLCASVNNRGLHAQNTDRSSRIIIYGSVTWLIHYITVMFRCLRYVWDRNVKTL
jgi:hypothetical protein